MRNLLAISCGLSLLGLSACGTFIPHNNFERMSPEELAIHNSQVSADEQVYCFEEVRTGSHMKKRYCATRSELTGGVGDDISRLGVLDANSLRDPVQPVYSQ